MSKFQDIDNTQVFKQPILEAETVPDRHEARFVVEVIAQMDLSAFEDAYTGCGRKPYAPAMMLSLLIYGYLTGVFSSRRIETATYDSIAFRFIAGNTHPDHASIAGFRKRFQEQFKSVFQKVLEFAHELKLVKLGQVAVDGTKIRANASKHAALSYGHILKLQALLARQVNELVAQADKADNKDRPGLINYPGEISRRQGIQAEVAKAKAVIEARAAARYAGEVAEHEALVAQRAAKALKTGKKHGGRPPTPPTPGARARDQVNLTDEQSRIMAVSGGSFEQAYNGQAAVDVTSMLIVAVTLTQETNDMGQVVPMLQALAHAPGALGKVHTFIADTGYCSAANVEACNAAGIEPVIASQREKHHPESATERFEEPPPLREGATPVEKMNHTRKTPKGRAVYALRKQTVEPVFGIIKSIMRFRQFSMRGLNAARNEWHLVCLSWNIKRMAVLRLA